MDIYKFLQEMISKVGVPFALVFWLLIKADRYVAHFMNHFGEITKAMKELTDEVKNFKYYIHSQEPPHEGD